MQTLLTIAGFDPSSGAGITADLAVFAAHGFFGTSAITALTVQSTRGVEGTHAVDATVLRDTLRVLVEDLPPAGIKLGMLANAANVNAAADFLRTLREEGSEADVVLDTVLRSSSGRDLLDREGLRALEEDLLPLVDWITPNTAELAVLTAQPITSRDHVEQAAAELLDRYPHLHLVATGGDSFGASDFLLSAGGSQWFPGERIESTSTHGTGCAFSSALLAAMVRGLSEADAVHHAKTYVTEAIRTAPGLGHGRGPLNLLPPLKLR